MISTYWGAAEVLLEHGLDLIVVNKPYDVRIDNKDWPYTMRKHIEQVRTTLPALLFATMLIDLIILENKRMSNLKNTWQIPLQKPKADLLNAEFSIRIRFHFSPHNTDHPFFFLSISLLTELANELLEALRARKRLNPYSHYAKAYS